MSILMFLAPTSIALGLLGLAAFLWTVNNDQYDDPDGDAARILYDHEDDGPG
jgi:cbb3-type cytochrome oxidase maturation protein